MAEQQNEQQQKLSRGRRGAPLLRERLSRADAPGFMAADALHTIEYDGT